MSEHKDADILRFGKDNQALLDVLDIYASKNNSTILEVLIVEIGLPGYIAGAIFNHQEISEENRKFIDEWIRDQRALHANVLGSHQDEIAVRLIGKTASKVDVKKQIPRDDSSDLFTRDDLVDDDYKG